MKNLLVVLVAILGLVSYSAFADDEMDVPPPPMDDAAAATVPADAAPAPAVTKKKAHKKRIAKAKKKAKRRAQKKHEGNHDGHNHPAGVEHDADPAPVIEE